MYQEPYQHQEQQHLLDQIIVSALPLEFHHADIVRQYRDGELTRLEAEMEDILRGCQKAEEPGEATPISLSGESLAAMKQLNCLALIQDGQVLPLLDIEQMPTATTALQKAHLYHAAASTLLDAIAAILEDRDQRKKDDDNEGGYSYAH